MSELDFQEKTSEVSPVVSDDNDSEDESTSDTTGDETRNLSRSLQFVNTLIRNKRDNLARQIKKIERLEETLENLNLSCKSLRGEIRLLRKLSEEKHKMLNNILAN